MANKRPIFSRKHYIAIARVLRQTGASEEIIKEFADAFATDNGSFSEVRFRKFIAS